MNALPKTNYVLVLTALFWAFDSLFAYVPQKSNAQEKTLLEQAMSCNTFRGRLSTSLEMQTLGL